ncbi:hypothetical protein [Paracoccus sp. pheM1]|uniref:hypothetical protein n=1 Tax=Paracoccus sp. pheM1 TaxID=2831675 RepID=UPI001BDB6D8D|nr:hypothetical protein [Paracoccus sp. pheM1]MBT0781752.1 hypothetical protein [Paracoccus sp. pheM1]
MKFVQLPMPSGRFIVILVVVFLGIWSSLMTGSLAASVCVNPKYGEAKRLRYCNLSLGISRIWLVAAEDHEMSRIYLERGILLANAIERQDAERDMLRALELASSGEPRAKLLEILNATEASPIIKNSGRPDPWVSALLVRVEQPDVSEHAKQIWYEVVAEVLSGGEG